MRSLAYALTILAGVSQLALAHPLRRSLPLPARSHRRRLHDGNSGPLVLQPAQSDEVSTRSQTVMDHIDDPSIFERTLTAEVDELERRVLAEIENWYGDLDETESSGYEIPTQATDLQLRQSVSSVNGTTEHDKRVFRDPQWDAGFEQIASDSSEPASAPVLAASPGMWGEGDSGVASPLAAAGSGEALEQPGTHPQPVQNFAHANAVGADDEDRAADSVEDESEDDGEEEDEDELETLWDENDPYFAESGESGEGDFYRFKRDRLARRKQDRSKAKPKTKSKTKSVSKSKSKASTKKVVIGRKGLLGYTDKQAGPSGATAKTTKRSGPNGSQAWLNNGISKSRRAGKWSPPALKLSQLKTVSLSDALKSSSSPYHACKRFLPLFNASAKKHNLPPILLAALAMQESSCNADTRGGGGEHGLMQLIKENCRGRDSAGCMEPKFNIETAAALFANNLKTAGGDILVALAAYNGWYRGMSYKSATQAARTSCCRCQQNLDYLHQMLNGWLLNISPYEHRLGILRNLDVCGP